MKTNKKISGTKLKHMQQSLWDVLEAGIFIAPLSALKNWKGHKYWLNDETQTVWKNKKKIFKPSQWQEIILKEEEKLRKQKQRKQYKESTNLRTGRVLWVDKKTDRLLAQLIKREDGSKLIDSYINRETL